MIISDHDFCPDFCFSLSFARLSESGDVKHLEFRLEGLFLFNQLKQVFATVKFDLDPD